jgi:hypothetical protein
MARLRLRNKLVDYVIEICKERGLESVYGSCFQKTGGN